MTTSTVLTKEQQHSLAALARLIREDGTKALQSVSLSTLKELLYLSPEEVDELYYSDQYPDDVLTGLYDFYHGRS